MEDASLNTPTHAPRWINPVTVVFFLAVVVDLMYCAYWASIDAVLSRGFVDYLAISAYPFTAPAQSVIYALQRLQDPYTGHVWQWEIVACAMLAIAMVTALVSSVVSTNERLRKIAAWAGIPIILLWLVGAFIAIPLSSIG